MVGLERPVICLAVGFRIGSRGDSAYARQVGQSIHDVGECGSWLVAAAGNSAPGQADRVYPAALLADGDDLHLDDLPMVAVGALNDDGEPAAYGIHGPWVKYMYPGKGVSIVPGSVPASGGGEAAQPSGTGEDMHAHAHDGDAEPYRILRYGAGYAYGEGTSVAAAGFAARLAQAMLDDPDGGVGDVRPQVATGRVRRALKTVGEHVK